jgi:hypothetical protein
VKEMPVMLSKSTTLRALHSEVTAPKEGCHPERSVLCEVKDLNFAILRCFTAAMNAAVQARLSLGAPERQRKAGCIRVLTCLSGKRTISPVK